MQYFTATDADSFTCADVELLDDDNVKRPGGNIRIRIKSHNSQ